MPVYEYTCSDCQHDFEHLARSMAGSEKVRCPDCDSGAVVRRLSVFAPHPGGSSAGPVSGGGCGRCGDPNGPCG